MLLASKFMCFLSWNSIVEASRDGQDKDLSREETKLMQVNAGSEGSLTGIKQLEMAGRLGLQRRTPNGFEKIA